jgi:hypothetical protein
LRQWRSQRSRKPRKSSPELNLKSGREITVTKLFAIAAACAMFAPMAMATLNQAAQIVA